MTDPTRDAEQAVREARRDVETGNLHPMRHDIFCARLDALITAVRQAERARIRGIVEGAPCYEVETNEGYAVKRYILAALDGAE